MAPPSPADPLASFAATLAGFLADLDVALPGLVEACYLTGSLVLDDIRPGQSDVDFVAVTARPPSADELTAVAQAVARHHARSPRPVLDGVFLTWADLAGGPPVVDGPRLAVHDGRAELSDGAACPVTWHTLAEHGVAVRGPAPAEFEVWTDGEALAAWTRGNLESYWRRWARRCGRLWSRWGPVSLGDWAVAWGVLGVTRLHYTLATGRITSKTGAGRYALEVFGLRWERIVGEALRIRGEPGRRRYGNRLARRRDLLAYVHMVIDDAEGPEPAA